MAKKNFAPPIIRKKGFPGSKRAFIGGTVAAYAVVCYRVEVMAVLRVSIMTEFGDWIAHPADVGVFAKNTNKYNSL